MLERVARNTLRQSLGLSRLRPRRRFLTQGNWLLPRSEPSAVTLESVRILRSEGSRVHGMVSRAVWVVVVALTVASACADMMPSYQLFHSRNNRFQLKLLTDSGANPEVWSLTDLVSDRVLYRVNARLGWKWVYVSDDGHNLCVVDFYCDGDQRLRDTALEFYRDGRLTHSYTVGALVPDARFTKGGTDSCWWLAEGSIGWPDRFSRFAEPDGTLSFTTFDFTVHVFDLSSGRIVGVHCSPLVPEGARPISGLIRLTLLVTAEGTQRRFLATSSCGYCGRAAPVGPVSFEVPTGFQPPPTFEWLDDENLLPTIAGNATVFVRDGQLVGAIPVFLYRCE